MQATSWSGADGIERRHDPGASLDRVGAAGAEHAARRRVERARDVALQHDAIARLAFGSGTGAAESSACV